MRVALFLSAKMSLQVPLETGAKVPLGCAGAVMLHRNVYTEIGSWDTTFFLDYEDGDISMRLWQHGWECRIEPNALVYHAVGASNHKTINKVHSSVGRKRYVWAISNKLAVILKTFTEFRMVLYPLLLWGHHVLGDLIKCRFENLALDVAAGWLTLRRAPSFYRYRITHRDSNRSRPGQDFFKAWASQLDQ